MGVESIACWCEKLTSKRRNQKCLHWTIVVLDNKNTNGKSAFKKYETFSDDCRGSPCMGQHSSIPLSGPTMVTEWKELQDTDGLFKPIEHGHSPEESWGQKEEEQSGPVTIFVFRSTRWIKFAVLIGVTKCH